ncbi:MAG: metallophosphoesterase [Thermoguttaceae bacterium]|nr:metallophosphoesterase [Thermoguttaceae bacterium]
MNPSSNGSQGFDRRSFFGSLAAAGLTGSVLASGADALAQDGAKPAEKPAQPEKIAASFPLLQNVTETSASIAWSLNRPATGWVEWGTTPDLGKFARNSEFGLNPYEVDFLNARIEGLAPNTKYYYRTATCSFDYVNAYNKTVSAPEYSDVYSFETVGPAPEKVSFGVMNDTHNTVPTICKLIERFDELKPNFIVWNGDVCSDYMTSEVAKKSIANPNGKPYAAERPLVFAAGNHDRRGKWVRDLKKCFTTWKHDDPHFAELGCNYAFRQGPLAAVILDTGEDKPDWHPAWSSMANYEPYRELQAAWLESALSRPEIASAPFIVAFCHIPLYDANPKANPGNILDKWASYQWTCQKLWGPILHRHGVQLLVAAHQHRFSYAEPTAERGWAQIVGGGPELKGATCIHATVTKDEMKLSAEMVADKKALGSWTFKPRKV